MPSHMSSNSAFDRHLREALEARAALGSGPACLDAETLAAWAEGGLDARERARMEAHAADCSTCQALLAALVRTTPAPAFAKPWWRRPVGWLVPLTAAAAFVLWAIVPARNALQPPVPVVPRGDSATELAHAPVPADKALADPKPDARPHRSVPSRSVSAPLASAKPSTDMVAAATPTSSPQAAPPQLASPEPVPSAPVSTPAPAVAGILARAPQAAAARAEQFLDAPVRERAAADIMSSESSSRWRIASLGVVEHSVDGGATWETQQTGVTVTLNAGSSPSLSVCWLVGPSGIVLQTSDGRSWRRIAFPEPVNLVAIRATDDRTATVTAADGRRFRTADGGLTWTRQENP